MSVTFETVEAIVNMSQAREVAKAIMSEYGVTIKLSGKGRTIEAIKDDCYLALPLAGQSCELTCDVCHQQHSSVTCDVCNYQSSVLPTASTDLLSITLPTLDTKDQPMPIIRQALKKAIPASSIMEHPELTIAAPIGAVIGATVAAKKAKFGTKIMASISGAIVGAMVATTLTVGIKGYQQGK